SVAGITTGVMIAIARVIGETAPLLVTVGIAQNVNWDAFDGRIATLPVYVYRQYAQGGVAADRAWAGALALIIIVMLLYLIARLVSRYFAPKEARWVPSGERTTDEQEYRHVRPERLLRRRPRRRARADEHRAAQRHRADRALGLRQVHVPAHPEPDARGHPRRTCDRQGGDGRAGPVR